MKFLRYSTLVILAALLGFGSAIGSLGEGTLAQAQAECTVTLPPDQSIQEAIDQAQEDDVICLSAGEWRENVVIEKGLTLRGAGREQSAIKGKEEGKPVIHIKSDSEIEVTLEGLTIAEGKGWDGDGIWIGGKAKVIIRNSEISGNGKDGILMGDFSQATIRDNKIFENKGYGVALYQRPCYDTDSKFEGKVEGSGNEIHDNGKGDVCPSPELDFLMSEEGGEYRGG